MYVHWMEDQTEILINQLPVLSDLVSQLTQRVS